MNAWDLVATSILAQDVIAFLGMIFPRRSVPGFLHSDNGSEFTAESVQAWLLTPISNALAGLLADWNATALFVVAGACLTITALLAAINGNIRSSATQSP